MQTRATLLLIAALVATPVVSTAGGEPIAVVVNKANPVGALGKSELRPIFQTTRTTWGDGSKVMPLNLPGEADSRIDFDQAVLGMNPNAVAQYWTDRKIRGGERPPTKIPNPAVVLKVVSAKKDAIGYVPKSALNGSVKVVAWIKGGQVTGP